MGTPDRTAHHCARCLRTRRQILSRTLSSRVSGLFPAAHFAPLGITPGLCCLCVRPVCTHFWDSRTFQNELSVKTSEILGGHGHPERMVWRVCPLNRRQPRKLDFSCFGMAAPPQRWPRLPCPWQRPHGSVGGNPHGRLGTARRISGHRASDGEGHAGAQSRIRHYRERRASPFRAGRVEGQCTRT